jgi:hypothetical protein
VKFCNLTPGLAGVALEAAPRNAMIRALTAIAAIKDSINEVCGFRSSKDCFFATLLGENRDLDPSTEAKRAECPLHGNASEFAVMTILSLWW